MWRRFEHGRPDADASRVRRSAHAHRRRVPAGALVCHIPKNDALAAHKAGTTPRHGSAEYWTWTAWNHVRMVASLATVVQFAALLPLGHLGAGYGGLPYGLWPCFLLPVSMCRNNAISSTTRMLPTQMR